MKRAQFPAYTTFAPRRAAMPPVIVSLPVKPASVPEAIARWPYRDIGAVVLSFPSDLRPRAE